MPWLYRIETGWLGHDALRVGSGYSGRDEGRNNPKMIAVQGVGPIPIGKYSIGPAYDHPHLGPCVMNLDPLEGTNTFGRSLFRIHGDNSQHDASHGCIVIGPALRKAVAASKDKILEVIE
jgi:hypothetical protein